MLYTVLLQKNLQFSHKVLPEIRVHMLVPLLGWPASNAVVRKINTHFLLLCRFIKQPRLSKFNTALTLVSGQDTVLEALPGLLACLLGLRGESITCEYTAS